MYSRPDQEEKMERDKLIREILEDLYTWDWDSLAEFAEQHMQDMLNKMSDEEIEQEHTLWFDK